MHKYLELFAESLKSERNASTNTVQSYILDLEDFEKKVSLSHAITTDDIAEYLKELDSRGYKVSSIKRKISSLKQFFKFLYAEELIDKNPMAFISQPKTGRALPKILSESDIEKLKVAAKCMPTYEEQLPDDIIEASDVYTSKIYGMHIIPARKPPYFEKPVIAIVIDDMGISLKRTADIASLHAPLTASFLTYGRNLSEQIENSRRAGQEIIIHIPMEAKSDIDTAPDVLTTKMSKDEIKQNLTAMLKKFDNVLGINNHMGSKLTEDKERMSAIMEILKQNNLFFLDSKTSANSQADKAATKIGVAYAHRHVFIDNNNDKKYIF